MALVKMARPRCVVAEQLTGTYGRFTAQPFERGWGNTIGQAMYKSLLALPGAAVTAVCINGGTVSDARQPVAGIVEDSEQLLLNIISLRLALDSDRDEGMMVLPSLETGEDSKELRADQFDGIGVRVITPEVKIATVLPNGKFRLTVKVRRGRGYRVAPIHDEDAAHGWIPVDAAFSPVRRVEMVVAGARLGEGTDYEKVILDVWTNGAISPAQAVRDAGELLKAHFGIFPREGEEDEPVLVPFAEPKKVDPSAEWLDHALEELELSVRSMNCLKSAGILTIRELVQKTESEIQLTKNFGKQSLVEIKAMLHAMGLSFGMKAKVPPPGAGGV